jgi:hypothetical protein
MTGFVVPFRRKKTVAADWSQAELAEFYRVEAALITAGMRVETDRGMTDEGDPWFVFCHAGEEREVIIHFARDSGRYLVSASSLDGIQVGDDFRTLVRQLLTRYDEIAARRRDAMSGKSGKVVLHPAAMLWVLVALAFLKSADAQSEEHHTVTAQDPALSPRDTGTNPLSPMISYALQAITVTWAAAVGLLVSETHPGPADTFLSWLAPEPPFAPETAVTFVSPSHPAPVFADVPRDMPGTYWADHMGSGGVAGIVPLAPPEHASSDHANDHANDHAMPGFITATGTPGGAAEMASGLVVVEPLSPPTPLPAGGIQTALSVTETHMIPKNAESAPALPEALVTALGHAIHLAGGEDVTRTVAEARKVLSGASPTGGHEEATNETHAGTMAPDQGGGTFSPPSAAPVNETAALSGVSDLAPVSGPVFGKAVADHPVDPAPSVASPPVETAMGPLTPVMATAAPNTLSPPPDRVELAVATAAVHDFLASVPQARTITGPDTLIVYDPLAVDIDLAHVQALTFDFSDGSHISLVGLPSELTHALAGHH